MGSTDIDRQINAVVSHLHSREQAAGPRRAAGSGRRYVRPCMLWGMQIPLRPSSAAVLLIAAFITAADAHAAPVCDVRSMGGKGDGSTKDTAVIQRAIDACAPKRGTVVLEGGKFLSAPLTLKSGVTLRIAPGATLLGSRDLEDYPIRQDAKWRRVALLHGDHLRNVTVNGGGTVDGSGDVFWKLAHEHRVPGDTSGSGGFPRPMLIDITESQHLEFSNLTAQNSPMYNFTFFFCDGIKIDHVVIRNPDRTAPNTDGIDPFSSRNIEISNVDIDTGDDDIALKSGLVERDPKIGPVEHVYIHDSVFRRGHGLSVGSELAGGIRDVRVENVEMDGTDAGVRIKSNRGRGNDIHDLHYRNIRMTNVRQPIQITEYYPRIPDTDVAPAIDAHTPRFHDISLENISATGAEDAVIVGLPEMPVRALTLSNVTIAAQRPMRIRNAEVRMRHVQVTVPGGKGIVEEIGARLERGGQ